MAETWLFRCIYHDDGINVAEESSRGGSRVAPQGSFIVKISPQIAHDTYKNVRQ